MAKKAAGLAQAVHEIEPVFDKSSRVLILGSFPSVKSREGRFFYHHPQNRFWKVIAALTGEPVPKTIEEKKALLLKHHIAVWDVVESCDIAGSSDTSIKNVRPNDLNRILLQAPVTKIFANGGKAWELYRKYCQSVTGHSCEKLPSTSPANAAFSLEKLILAWEPVVLAAREV